jgi:hypothetical protein
MQNIEKIGNKWGDLRNALRKERGDSRGKPGVNARTNRAGQVISNLLVA